MKNFYITTPIYYVNDKPHIGHAYTTIVSDVLARYHRMFGAPTLFLTGVDEHGQKVEQAAEANHRAPQAHCDLMSENFRKIWDELEVKYDIFYRTTDDFHKKAVQDSLQAVYDQGDIYTQEYEGWYSVSEEQFFTEKDLVNGKSPNGKEVTLVKETNYFFKMSKYQQRLIDYIEKNPEFIQPDYRKNEVLGFLRQPLQDLCISRPKARLSWGIPLPFDKNYVTYVWFDALMNYAVGAGLNRPEMSESFQKWWGQSQGGAVHIIGKDILTFHAVYWPTMLMALNIELPRTIFAHGWWLTASNEKMSKSSGPTVSPLDMKDKVGVDGLRYFLIRDIYFGNDAQFSPDLVISRVNSELANNLGNLLSRSTNLIDKYFNAKMPWPLLRQENSQRLKTLALGTAEKLKQDILEFSPNKAVGHVVDLLNEANRYLEEESPWKSAKENLEKAQESLVVTLEVLRIAATLLQPVMPEKMRNLLEIIGYKREADFESAKQWGLIKPGVTITKTAPLFPRIKEDK